MGKTVFLKEAQDRLTSRGWLCGYYEVRRKADPGLALAQIIADTYERQGGGSWMKRMLGKSPIGLGTVTLTAPAGLGTVSIDVAEATKAADPYRDLYAFLSKLAARATKEDAGVVFLIDELQLFRQRDLEVLLQVSRRLEGHRMAIVGAGLPTLPALTAKAGTYTERFSFEEIDRLSPHEAAAAVTEPAKDFDVTVARAALAEILERSEGYPYFLQLYASETWKAAGTPSERPGYVITRSHVDQAIPEVQRKVDAGLYKSRYDRASDGERAYLKEMAALGDKGVSSGDVAHALGKRLQQVSVVRDRLIEKGAIHSTGVGKLDFSVPGFGEYVRRQAAIDS